MAIFRPFSIPLMSNRGLHLFFAIMAFLSYTVIKPLDSGGCSVNNLLISGGRDYDVPCMYCITGKEKTLCVVVHGFGGSKQGLTGSMILKEMPPLGIGVIAFDFPGHGESRADDGSLRLDNCLSDLSAVEAFARGMAPEAEIVFFASSFGAYVALIYFAELKHSGRRAFLRSAAVNMHHNFTRQLRREQLNSLEASGKLVLSKAEYGYARDMKLTRGFVDDLENHDIFSIWKEGFAEIRMIHGGSDRVIPLRDAKSFAERFRIPLTIVPNGDHQLSTPGVPEQVIKAAVGFSLIHKG